MKQKKNWKLSLFFSMNKIIIFSNKKKLSVFLFLLKKRFVFLYRIPISTFGGVDDGSIWIVDWKFCSTTIIVVVVVKKNPINKSINVFFKHRILRHRIAIYFIECVCSGCWKNIFHHYCYLIGYHGCRFFEKFFQIDRFFLCDRIIIIIVVFYVVRWHQVSWFLSHSLVDHDQYWKKDFQKKKSIISVQILVTRWKSK